MADGITYVETYALYVVLCGEESAADERIVDGLVAERPRRLGTTAVDGCGGEAGDE
jgi:hypothetical protein